MNTRIIRLLFGTTIALAIALLLLVMPMPTPTRAAPSTIFTVNSNTDVADANPGDGKCETSSGNGICTLRAAVTEANATSGATINFNLGGSVTYLLTLGQLPLTRSMTISGTGAANTIIDGNANDRVFDISPGVVVSISGVTIRNGRSNDGGGIYNNNNGYLSLANSVVVSNTATGQGGGIYNGGSLSLNNSVVVSNTATGVLPNGGGGIYNTGMLTISRSFINNNYGGFGGGGIDNAGTLGLFSSDVDGNSTANFGGAIWIESGSASILASTLGSNVAGDGGGIFLGYPGSGVITVTNSSIFSNTATATASPADGGGGIYNYNGTATLINSTLYLNAANTYGGGLLNYSGVTNLYNVTMALNFADLDANNIGSGGGISQTFGTVTLRNTILAGNYKANACIFCPTPDDCKGTLNSEDFNLIQTTTGCTVGGATGNNKTGVDPNLSYPPKYNGGPTLNLALLPGSPAIDAGNTGGCRDGLGALIPTDQRGFGRPAFGGIALRCDIGAFEYYSNTLFLPLIVK